MSSIKLVKKIIPEKKSVRLKRFLKNYFGIFIDLAICMFFVYYAVIAIKGITSIDFVSIYNCLITTSIMAVVSLLIIYWVGSGLKKRFYQKYKTRSLAWLLFGK